MAEIIDSVTPLATITPPSTTPGSRTLHVHEDYWSGEATSSLIDSWGSRYKRSAVDNGYINRNYFVVFVTASTVDSDEEEGGESEGGVEEMKG
ncbi:hypothetical protein V6N11_051764 [Hibiscus sabdariffa]|uniref:Uncharacterized protein n=1 Tax=Hibiscus sabdariffa TaxID=183260 RepID=A0ABR2U896_9ROSI